MWISASKTYWLIVIGLFGVSVFFAHRVEKYRSGIQRGSGKLCLEHMQVATVVGVGDGDEITVQSGKCISTVRILGVKAFNHIKSELPIQPIARQALERLKRLLGEKVTIMAPDPNKPALKLDNRKRTLAILSMEGKDIGLDMVRDGLVMVYRKYQFMGLARYIAVEIRAQAEGRGLWSNPAATKRAEALQRAWEREQAQ